MQTNPERHASSYRDPAGFLFTSNGTLYRQVNKRYEADYQLLQASGLYQNLVNRGLLVPHRERRENLTGSADWFLTLEPAVVPFISYPWEWCFAQHKEAALLTLEIASAALDHGMVLKDASAFNVQWRNGSLQFIDTLSFSRWDASQPWIAYRQFCEHFLAPLALQHFTKQPTGPLFLAYPNGLPLSLVASLLPWKSRFHLHSVLHLSLQAKLSRRSVAAKPTTFSATKMKNLLRSLTDAVKAYTMDAPTGVWSGYYNEACERPDYVQAKLALINRWLDQLPMRTAVDAGANEGLFSELLAKRGVATVSLDMDHYAVNRLYTKSRAAKSAILPLVADLTAPSPATGVNNREWPSLLQRSRFDLVLALALIHHLCIGKNIPFTDCAALFRNLGRQLLLEFVPTSDEKVQQMLAQKENIYDWYTLENLEAAFGQFYTIDAREPVGSSGRTLLLLTPR